MTFQKISLILFTTCYKKYGCIFGEKNILLGSTGYSPMCRSKYIPSERNNFKMNFIYSN